jgi:hypothetical protein
MKHCLRLKEASKKVGKGEWKKEQVSFYQTYLQ